MYQNYEGLNELIRRVNSTPDYVWPRLTLGEAYAEKSTNLHISSFTQSSAGTTSICTMGVAMVTRQLVYLNSSASKIVSARGNGEQCHNYSIQLDITPKLVHWLKMNKTVSKKRYFVKPNYSVFTNTCLKNVIPKINTGFP